MLNPGIFAVIIFVVVLLLIMTQKVDATVAALLGAAMAMVFLIIVWPSWTALVSPPGEAFTYDVFARLLTQWLDFRTIIIILAVMIIAEPVKDSGLFQFIAVKALRFTRGRPSLLLAILCLITFATSMVITRMAAMILIASLTIIICGALDLHPAPFLISEAMVANPGVTSTMISGPPNLLVAEAAGFSFLWYLVNTTPLMFVMTLATILVCTLLFRKQLTQISPERQEQLMNLDAWMMVPDRGLFYRTAALLVATVVGFIAFPQLTFLVAILSAVAFLLGGHPDRVIKAVQWSSILFFAGLFFVVGTMNVFGVTLALARIAEVSLSGNAFTAPLGILSTGWLATNAVDDTALTLLLVPVVQFLISRGMSAVPLWLSLLLGVQLGAILPIANTSNILAWRMAEEDGHPLSYRQFVAVGTIVSLLYLGLSALYLILRVLLLHGL
jgi:Na+/H+ antiporter NhaD/arsenite permease-like protein